MYYMHYEAQNRKMKFLLNVLFVIMSFSENKHLSSATTVAAQPL